LANHVDDMVLALGIQVVGPHRIAPQHRDGSDEVTAGIEHEQHRRAVRDQRDRLAAVEPFPNRRPQDPRAHIPT